MLSKTQRTAAEHGISQEELEALLWVRTQLALGTIKAFKQGSGAGIHLRHPPVGDTFCMSSPYRLLRNDKGDACGTEACIGGWMALYMGLNKGVDTTFRNPIADYVKRAKDTSLKPLFWPMWGLQGEAMTAVPFTCYETPAQAVAAIDRWLDGERDVRKLWPAPDRQRLKTV